MRHFGFVLALAVAHIAAAQTPAAPAPLTGLKAEAVALVDANTKLTQEIVDSPFSFAELGFQEYETQRYLTAILERERFKVERGVSGLPTSTTAAGFDFERRAA